MIPRLFLNLLMDCLFNLGVLVFLIWSYINIIENRDLITLQSIKIDTLETRILVLETVAVRKDEVDGERRN